MGTDYFHFEYDYIHENDVSSHVTFVLISLMLLILYSALSISLHMFLNVICVVCVK